MTRLYCAIQDALARGVRSRRWTALLDLVRDEITRRGENAAQILRGLDPA